MVVVDELDGEATRRNAKGRLVGPTEQPPLLWSDSRRQQKAEAAAVQLLGALPLLLLLLPKRFRLA